MGVSSTAMLMIRSGQSISATASAVDNVTVGVTAEFRQDTSPAIKVHLARQTSMSLPGRHYLRLYSDVLTFFLLRSSKSNRGEQQPA